MFLCDPGYIFSGTGMKGLFNRLLKQGIPLTIALLCLQQTLLVGRILNDTD
jgi:hypothetical protein